MPRVAFITLGCKVNQFETEVIEGLFAQQGYQAVHSDEPADIYVINTCSVTHVGEKKSRQLIRRASRLNPEAMIVVTGCYAQISPDQVAAIPGVDLIIGTQDRRRIVELVEAARDQRQQVNAVSDIMQAWEFEDIPLFSRQGRTRAFLKIQEGCDNYCTYCIIPYTRGHLRSRPLASVIAEAEKLITAGFQEIVLTGIHLGAYGRDLGGISLEDAVAALLALPTLQRVRLSSLESIEVSDGLVRLMEQDERFCRHLHLPLQAGSDPVLQAMNRHYTTADFRRQLDALLARLPDLAVSTDIIVGFPGETEELFEQALAFVATLPLARIHVFPYSPRAGTPAATYSGQISEAEKKRRTHAMQEVGDILAKEYRLRYVGNQGTVLFEHAKPGLAEGLTSNYLRVYVKEASDLAGQIHCVRLDSLYKDGLLGTLLSSGSSNEI
jgi:threonylcarbamoyladenosine tRNA methylthiotransferase MtaB